MHKLLISKDKMLRYNLDTVLICLALSAVGIYLNGVFALYQIAVCVVSCLFAEFICFHVILKKKTLTDLSALGVGFTLSMLLPAHAPLYVGAAAAFFAVFIAKFPFGNSRNAPFLPAAAGFCFAAIFFPKEVFTYTAISDPIIALFSSDEGFAAGTSLAAMLKNGNSITLNIFGVSKLLSGRIPGAVGTVSLLALTGALIYLIIRDPKRLLASSGFILSAAVFAFCFPRINAGRLTSVILELCAGSLIFTALLLINNPVNTPKGKGKAFLYGFAGGIIAMLLRYFSVLGDPTVFSVLIMNALWPRNSFSKKAKGKELKVNG